jgi:hypothetical protein
MMSGKTALGIISLTQGFLSYRSIRICRHQRNLIYWNGIELSFFRSFYNPPPKYSGGFTLKGLRERTFLFTTVIEIPMITPIPFGMIIYTNSYIFYAIQALRKVFL